MTERILRKRIMRLIHPMDPRETDGPAWLELARQGILIEQSGSYKSAKPSWYNSICAQAFSSKPGKDWAYRRVGLNKKNLDLDHLRQFYSSSKELREAGLEY